MKKETKEYPLAFTKKFALPVTLKELALISKSLKSMIAYFELGEEETEFRALVERVDQFGCAAGDILDLIKAGQPLPDGVEIISVPIEDPTPTNGNDTLVN